MTTDDLHLPPRDHRTVEEGASITFIGTATVLVRYRSITFLTDPNFLHAGDHARLGYGLRSRRLTDPALELDQLPPLDFVLLSHHHGDHFDHVVERQLDRAIPIITEPGSARRLRKLGFEATRALETWESVTVRRGLQWLEVTAMPARHARRPIDAFLPSVMGSMVRFGHGDAEDAFHMYVTGDTVLVDELVEIGRRHPAIDVCLLHLGGTRIAGLLLTMDAEQGVRLLELLGPRTAVPIHYDDYTVFKSPLRDFLALVDRSELSTRVVALDRGETHRLDVPTTDPAHGAGFARIFDTFIERDGLEWAVCAHVDDQRRVISRHPTAALAADAERYLHESANRSAGESG
jgi:L-ascorbate metabolism protein UlaG (beta-lactamase superfamily)